MTASRPDDLSVFPEKYSRYPTMSFEQDEDELDWGDAGDVVSLGDEDEIPCIAAAGENIGEETAPLYSAQDEDFESTAMPTTSPAAALSHPLGLSHLPPKPQPVLHHRRSREMIKASSMSRIYPRANSPGVGDDLPRHWEVRRTETVIYYYHTEFRCSQVKRPTRDDARPDKFHWQGDAPPPASGRSQSARNPPSGPAEWPERSAPDHQHRSSARDKSPPRRASPPPRQRSPKPPRQRSNSALQPAPARAMSPSSMLLPRRGASPARGLAKSSNRPQRTDPDINISIDPQDNRNGRSRDSGWEQRGRSNARERDITRSSARMDHYSPPPDTGDSPPRRGSRHRSISPPRKAPMRSDAMVINQRGTLYLMHVDHYRLGIVMMPEVSSVLRLIVWQVILVTVGITRSSWVGEKLERPPFDRMASDTRYSRDYPVELGRGEYHDPREDHFRASNGRAPNQFPPGPEPVPPHPRDSASFSPHTEDAGYPVPPPGKFRDARFARPENRRTQPSRSSNVRSDRIEPQGDDPRLPPVAFRKEVPLQPRHELVSPRDGAASHRRARNGDVRDRMMPEDLGSPMDHESITSPHVERDLHPDVRQDERIRQHGHRRSVSGAEYMARRSQSPQIPRERDVPNVSPPRHPYPGRPRDFSPQDIAEPRESDLRSRDREPERYPPKGRREQHEPYSRGLRQEDPMPHVYEASSVPHARRIVPRDSETLASGRIYQPTESQRPPSPIPSAREAYPRRYVRDDQFSDLTPRDWDQEDEVPTPPEEARHVDRKSQQDTRRAQRGRSQERRESYRPPADARDSWHPAPNEDQDMEVEIIEGGKRQRIEGGTRMTQPFNHREEDLPRKVPQHSPSQRPKIHSPNNSLSKLPPPAPTVQPAVDFQAAVSRAKDVASQLTQANPQHKPRPKSRFDQPSDLTITTERDINRGLLVPNGSSGAFGATNTKETALSSETNERSSPEGVNSGRHGSEGSQSSHIVSRMDEASLRDNGYPQKRAERHRDSHPDTGPSRRDRNRSDRNGRNNGEKLSRFVDSYRPGAETPARGPGGMRAWGNPEAEPHRDPPPHTSAPSANRTYRNAGDRGFARPPQVVTSPEGLPPRPPTPTEFVHGARNRGQTAGQARSPLGKGGQSFTTVTDVDTTDAATDNETDLTPATGFSFRQASANSPRKYSLLDRMTDPTSGAPLTVPPKDRGSNNGQQQHRRPRSNRTGSRR
ncbi:hypothetical protein RSAG8_04599, partial [Rhizoctonia solani AG-8 WAC10335]